jgi:vacuolar protein sorting-associated protein IST1
LALAKKSRREIADLLVKGRLETSRLRVEGLIQDDIYVELLELLEVRHTYDRDSCG